MDFRYEKTKFGEQWKGGFYCRDTREIFLVRREDDALFIGELSDEKSAPFRKTGV